MVNPLRDCLGLIIQIITSTTGLFLLNLGYLLFGSYVFYILESPNEAQLVSDLADKRIYLIQQLDALERAAKTVPTDTTTSKDGVNDVKRNASILLADYEEKLADFYRKRAVLNINDESGSNATGQTKLWTPLGAIIYSYSVITTIGWGNIVPGTDNGKMVTIVYGIFGIPLLFALSTDTGNMVAAFNLRLWRLIHGTFSVASRVVGINKKSDEDEDEDDEDDNDNRWRDTSESNANAFSDWNFPLQSAERTEKEKLDCLRIRQKLDGKLQHLSEDIYSQTSYLKSAESTVNFMLDMALKNGPIEFEYVLSKLLPHKRILCQEDAIQLVQEIDSLAFSELKLCSELVGVPWRIFTRFFSEETQITVASTAEMTGDPEIGKGSNFGVTLSSATDMDELTVQSGQSSSPDVIEAQATEPTDAIISEPVEKTKLTNRMNNIHQTSKNKESECVIEPKLLDVFNQENIDLNHAVSCVKKDCLDSNNIQGDSAKVVMEYKEGKHIPNTEDKCGSSSNEQQVDCTVSNAVNKLENAYTTLMDKSGLLSTRVCLMNENAINDQLIQPSEDDGINTLSQSRLKQHEDLDSKTKKLALIFRKVLEVERLELIPGEAGKKKRLTRREKVSSETGLKINRKHDPSQQVTPSQTKHVAKQSHSVGDTGIKSSENDSNSGIKECSSKKSSRLDEASSRLSHAESLIVEVGSRLDDQISSRSYSSGRQRGNNAARIRHSTQKKNDWNNKPRIHSINKNLEQVKPAKRIFSQDFPAKLLDSVTLQPVNNHDAQGDNDAMKSKHPIIKETKDALQNSEVDTVYDSTSNKKIMNNLKCHSQSLRDCGSVCKTMSCVNAKTNCLNDNGFSKDIRPKTTDLSDDSNFHVPSKYIQLNSNLSDFTFREMPNALRNDTTGRYPNLPSQSHAASTKEPAKKVSRLVRDLNQMSDFVTLHARLNPNAKDAGMQDNKPESKLTKQSVLIHGRSDHSKESRYRDEKRLRQKCRSREGRSPRQSRSREGSSSRQSRSREGRSSRQSRSREGRSSRQSRSREGRSSRQSRSKEERSSRQSRSREGRSSTQSRFREGRSSRQDSRYRTGRSSRKECRFREGDVNQSADQNINYADFFGRGDDNDAASLLMSEMSLDYSEYTDDDIDDVDDDDAEPEVEVTKKEDESHLPLSVLYFFVIMYILAGSLVYFNFSKETEKKFLNWVYFIYVTLSTTGFGDILPEEHMLLFTAIYGLLGMAIFNILLNGTLETFLYAIDYINAFNVGADDEEEDDE
ncbi:potassium channel subfamily K member 10-like protein [Biomphalaria pfeifferi]|uniref:Potassium channel subfamily K member 10-like protein n=1 Tax=Biomphalaria pfeifferi TaxID=112525 RepID=A0AAD8BBV6_BIOPF|nr:potassium channel subfamily K member 10-like protein [Biomphalaria pfeifferi]